MNQSFLLNKDIKGFTLVEILVVLGLFSTIMTIAVGALITSQAVNVKLQETQSVLDNVNLSMETITREIRYGTEFHCDTTLLAASSTLRKDCTIDYNDPNNPNKQGGTVLFFRPHSFINDDRVAYYRSAEGIIYKDEYINGATTTYQISANNVNIRSLVFYVTGSYTATGTVKNSDNTKNDFIQPLITIVVDGETIPAKKYYKTVSGEGSAKRNIVATKFTVQTSISARELDN